MSQPRRDGDGERRYVRAAVIATILLGLFTVVVFTKSNPFSKGYEVRGVFTSATQLKAGSAVRIGGLDVGKVTRVQAGPGNTAVVTMRFDRERDRLHRDTRLAIEPRLFFEGNFYVDVSPGSPAEPKLKSGDTVPRSQTSVPVQLDQFLSAFTAPNRGALRRMLGEFGSGFGTGNQLGGPPVAGVTPGAAGLQTAARELDAALQPATVVAKAFQGTQPGDLRRAITNSANTAAEFDKSPAALADFVTNFNRTFAALASEDQNLAAGIRNLDDVLAVAPRSLTSIDRALPPTTAFARALQPTLRQAPATLRSTNRLLRQIDGLMSAGELPPLVATLRPVTATLPVLEARLKALFPFVSESLGCLGHNVVPTLNLKAPDGALSTGYPIWLDLIHTATALAGTSPAFDGNGTTIRLGVTGGEGELHGFLPGIGQVEASQNVSGVRPTWLGQGVSPPYRPDKPCTQQAIPDLSKRNSNGPPAGFTPQASTQTKADARVMQLVRDALAGKLDPTKLADAAAGDVTPQPAASTQAAATPAPATAAPSTPAATQQAVSDPVAPITKVGQDLGNGLSNALKSVLGGAAG